MILAAGLGTRMRPLSELRAKPAMPVRGVPAIGYTMALLARHGVRELIVNLHHLPETVRDAVERHVPEGLESRPRKLRELVQEEHTIVGEGDLSCSWRTAPTDQTSNANRVVW